MKPIAGLEYPPDVERIYRRARLVQWITVVHVSTASILVYLTMGSSQAMRTAFGEDVISITPAIAFLIATHIARRGPDRRFPYGRHRATSIGHLTSALALLAVGLFLLYDAAIALIWSEKPTIGGFDLFGRMIWGGWAMLAALTWATIPTVILGLIKARLAPQLHDKVLWTDSKMMKADWLSGAATAVGVVGAGLGFWWLDPAAAAFVSFEIVRDGVGNLKVAVADLIDRRPQRTDQSGPERLPEEVRQLLEGMDWVERAEVRMREEGHIFLGEAFVVPRAGTDDLAARLAQAAEEAKALDWRVHDLVLQPVESLPDLPERSAL